MNLPDPDVLALEIAEELEAALEQFTAIAAVSILNIANLWWAFIRSAREASLSTGRKSVTEWLCDCLFYDIDELEIGHLGIIFTTQ